MSHFTLLHSLIFGFTLLCSFAHANENTQANKSESESIEPYETKEPLFTAVYSGKHTGIKITMTRTLTQEGKQDFRLLSYAKNFLGSITDDSQFKIVDGQLRPQHYRYLRKVFGKTSDQNLYFDWETRQAKFRRSDKSEKNADYEFPENTLETALYQLKLQQELSAGKTQFHFTFAKDSRIKVLEFKVINNTQYTLNDKVYDAIEVERINQPDDRETNILLIPSLNFQIAQIIHTEDDGSSYKVKLSDYEGDTQRIAEFYQKIKQN